MEIDYNRKKKIMLEADGVGEMSSAGHRIAVSLLEVVAQHLYEQSGVKPDATIRKVVEKAWASLDSETQAQLTS